jgi:hypothetical protein
MNDDVSSVRAKSFVFSEHVSSREPEASRLSSAPRRTCFPRAKLGIADQMTADSGFAICYLLFVITLKGVPSSR